MSLSRTCLCYDLLKEDFPLNPDIVDWDSSLVGGIGFFSNLLALKKLVLKNFPYFESWQMICLAFRT